MRYDDNGMEDFLLISCGQQPKIIKTRVRRVFRWEWICMDDITHESFPSVFAVAIQTQSCFINWFNWNLYVDEGSLAFVMLMKESFSEMLAAEVVEGEK